MISRRSRAGSAFLSRAEDFLVVTRLHAAGLTMAPFVVGIGIGHPTNIDFLVSGLAAVSLHVFACAVNDVADLPQDRLNPSRGASPLVRGSMSPQSAVVIAATGALAYITCTIAITDDYHVRALYIAVLAVQAYGNVAQKKSRVVPPLGMDLLFGAAMAMPILLGCAATGSSMSVAVVQIAVAFGLHAALLNAVAGNLKDLRPDLHASARTTALALGVRPGRSGCVRFTAQYIGLVSAYQSIACLMLLGSVVTSASGVTLLVGVLAIAVFEAWGAADLFACFAGRRPPSLRGHEPFIIANFAAWLAAVTVIAGPLAPIMVLFLVIAFRLGTALWLVRFGVGRDEAATRRTAVPGHPRRAEEGIA